MPVKLKLSPNLPKYIASIHDVVLEESDMCTQYTHEAACKKASQLGALVESGKEWTRARGFPSAEVAWYFQTMFNGMDSVGAFPDDSGRGFTVDFR